MTENDIPAGLALCRHAGWNQLERDWRILLEQGKGACLAAVDDADTVVGTAATIRYGSRFSWIGMVLVDPRMKRQGIGTRLLYEALSLLSDIDCVKLDATPAGREVYLKLDFTDEYRLSRMVNPSVHIPAGALNNIHNISAADMDGIAAFDATIFGASRKALLRGLREDTPELAFVARRQDTVSGYCLGRKGYNFIQVGPVIAEDADTARDLLTGALMACEGKAVAVDAMHFDDQWVHTLRTMGFTEQRPFIRMYKGTNRYPGVPEKQFAIVGPEFG